MTEWIAAVLAALKGMKAIQAVFRRGDIPICSTRVMPKHRLLPWGQQILVHPREDGIEIVYASVPEDSSTKPPAERSRS